MISLPKFKKALDPAAKNLIDEEEIQLAYLADILVEAFLDEKYREQKNKPTYYRNRNFR